MTNLTNSTTNIFVVYLLRDIPYALLEQIEKDENVVKIIEKQSLELSEIELFELEMSEI